MRVALQLPAYDEPRMASTMDAWAAQPVPHFVSDISREAWVTPSDGRTMQIAREHRGFKAFEAPSGKLPARNEAHDSAVRRGYDVMVAFDADAPPLTENTLPALLQPIYNGEAVATNAYADAEGGLLASVTNARERFKGAIGGVNGRGHAFTRSAWEHAGPFRQVNDADIKSVWVEEELKFPYRVRQVGPFKRAPDARVHRDLRRERCRLAKLKGDAESPFCERMSGDTTFAPERRR